MLQVRSLAARRGMRMVFRDIGFELVAGDALLVMGANGSGKSSLLRVLAGLLPVAKGEVVWAGSIPALHYIGHADAVKNELTVGEMLGYWGALRGVAVSGEALAVFGLTELAERPVRILSAGQRRRLSLTRLVLDEAPAWLLDEPLTALDAAGQKVLLELIARHRAKGGVAVMATHQSMACDGAQILEMR